MLDFCCWKKIDGLYYWWDKTFHITLNYIKWNSSAKINMKAKKKYIYNNVNEWGILIDYIYSACDINT